MVLFACKGGCITFKINDIVVHTHSGIFIIDDIILMDCGVGNQRYYSLKSYLSLDHNSSLVVYVPESKSEELLRYLISKDEAVDLLSFFSEIETEWDENIKDRKKRFSELLCSKNIIDSCIVLKSLYERQRILEKNNKNLKIIDIDFFKKSRLKVLGELSIVLECSEEEIEQKLLAEILL